MEDKIDFKEVSSENEDWQYSLRKATRSLLELKQRGVIPRHWTYTQELLESYPVFVTDYYLSLIRKGDPSCPIFKQVIPDPEEALGKGLSDPIGDNKHKIDGNIIHRYGNRILVLSTNRCPVNCRFCFRKNFLYSTEARSARVSGAEIENILAYLEKHPNVDEVIFSGGDPLILPDVLIKRIVQGFTKLDSVRTLRFHSRTIVTLPERITDELLAIFGNSRKNIVIVHHFNHPKEVTVEASQAIERLSTVKVLQLNQSALLRGVNDDAETLAELSRKLVHCNVLPYYLNVTDDVQGAQHFKVSVKDARNLYQALRVRVSGYQLPKLILDLPEATGKVFAAEADVILNDDDSLQYRISAGEYALSQRHN